MQPTFPITISQAIAKQEGFYKFDSRPHRNNNPGDLEWHPWQSEFNGIKGLDPRFTQFSTTNDGWACLRRLLTFKAYKGLTVREAIYEFAPGNENNTEQYIKNVCVWTGLTEDTIIDKFI